MIKNGSIIAIQLAILWAVNQLGYVIVSWTGIPLPGNVVGIFILLLLLMTKILPLSFVEKGASILVKHLGFFFIPISVGLIAYGDLFLSHGIPLAIVIIVSVMVGIYVSGIVSQVLVEKKEKKKHEHSRNPA
ncbi:CidA/LrgA family protein [Evansella sp. AB-P1]|uniref:CidA/LrgA family protein n=1 Tax=Evansella sp. AB-P1 TaxID=3037653 RepID=UPI00241E5C8B|nr:CidA/LrgA family protein [Evansella sp. AB-P1]MDG5786753.1 CidA/LrgA family protein [Evansella sp. AB-P1]